MFRFFLAFLLFCALPLLADKGISQEHLVGLTPVPSDVHVDPKTEIIIAFDQKIRDINLKRPVLTLKHKSDHKRVKGTPSLSEDAKSIRFTPDGPLQKGEHRLRLLPLKLQGSVDRPCNGLWNKTKAYMHKHFGWFKKEVCYERFPLTSMLITYTFTVSDSGPKVVSLQISPPTAQIDENRKTPVTVTARLEDNTTQDVSGEAEWESTDASVAEVVDGMIVGHGEGTARLTARYENTAEAMLTVDVYQSVDGHRLPHEVDESLNNATLLGIDANSNGVRDDVERWIHLQMQIYNGYPEIERAIAMQTAKAAQMALADPTNKGDKVHQAITASMDCWTYYEDSKGLPFNASLMKFSRALKEKVFNTKERLKTYFQYDATLAGRVFSPTPTLQTKEQCETDIDNL